VTGWLTNAVTNVDFVVGRFDGMTGARQWLVGLNDSRFNGNDFGEALSVTANGDIVVAGSMRANPGLSDFSAFRFSGTGALLWQKIIDRGFRDAARTVAVAPSGDVIVGGVLETSSGPDNFIFFVISLDA